MRYNHLKYILIVAGFSILLSACKKDTINLDDIPDPDLQAGLGLPIAQINLSMGGIIESIDEDDFFTIEDDGLIVKEYSDEFEFNWESLVTLKSVNHTLDLPLLGVSTPDSITISENISDRYSMNTFEEARYDAVIIESGNLSLSNISLPSNSTGSIVLQIPEMTNANGEIFTHTIDASNYGPESYDLKDYEINFGIGVDSSYVTLNTAIDVKVPAGSTGTISFVLSIDDITPKITFGYFGQHEIEIRDSIDFDIYDADEIFDAIELANVKFELTTTNPIGVPFSVQLDSVFFSDEGYNATQLQFYDTNVFMIDSATFDGDSILSKQQTFCVDTANSNILDVLNSFPNRVASKITGFSNPTSDPDNTRNFINHDNKLGAELHITFPLHFKVDDYQRRDTIEFDLNEEIDIQNIDEAIKQINLYFKVYNGFPFEVKIASIVGADENKIPIDSIVNSTGISLESGVPDADGHVKTPTLSDIVITIKDSQLQKLQEQDMKYIILETQGASHDSKNSYVKIFDDNTIQMAISVDFIGQLTNDLFDE